MEFIQQIENPQIQFYNFLCKHQSQFLMNAIIIIIKIPKPNILVIIKSMPNRNKIISFISILMFSFIFSISAIQQFDAKKINEHLQFKWSFISEIQHTWFKNIVNKYFNNCQELKQLHALYNCNTTIERYQPFWNQFLEGIFLIKFKEEPDNSQKKQIFDLLVESTRQWILVNKTQYIVPIEDAYEDIHSFPSNVLQFAQFTQNYEEQFNQLKELVNWQRSEKRYLSKKGKDQQIIEKDQAIILAKYFNRDCFANQNYGTQCNMPLQRYSYYLKQLFFYYFDQPQKYSNFDDKTNQVIIKPLLDYRITKLWRDMRKVMKSHIKLQDKVTLEDIESYSIDILESVMQSLVRNKQGSNRQGNSQGLGQNNDQNNGKNDQL